MSELVNSIVSYNQEVNIVSKTYKLSFYWHNFLINIEYDENSGHKIINISNLDFHIQYDWKEDRGEYVIYASTDNLENYICIGYPQRNILINDVKYSFSTLTSLYEINDFCKVVNEQYLMANFNSLIIKIDLYSNLIPDRKSITFTYKNYNINFDGIDLLNLSLKFKLDNKSSIVFVKNDKMYYKNQHYFNSDVKIYSLYYIPKDILCQVYQTLDKVYISKNKIHATFSYDSYTDSVLWLLEYNDNKAVLKYSVNESPKELLLELVDSSFWNYLNRY